MPIRFSTQAANDDTLGDEPSPAAAPDPASRNSNERNPPRSDHSGEARPGKDINAPGFVKDKDAGKP